MVTDLDLGDARTVSSFVVVGRDTVNELNVIDCLLFVIVVVVLMFQALSERGKMGRPARQP
jgi:hypothetical protein